MDTSYYDRALAICFDPPEIAFELRRSILLHYATVGQVRATVTYYPDRNPSLHLGLVSALLDGTPDDESFIEALRRIRPSDELTDLVLEGVAGLLDYAAAMYAGEAAELNVYVAHRAAGRA